MRTICRVSALIFAAALGAHPAQESQAPSPQPQAQLAPKREPKPVSNKALNAHPRAPMMRDLTKWINTELKDVFRGKPEVTCWMCHRGMDVPPNFPMPQQDEEFPQLEYAQKVMALTPEQEKQPAREVFKNLKHLAQMPAGRMPPVMAMFSRSLGVQCTFCHVKGDFASDANNHKKIARRMLTMVSGTSRAFYENKGTPVNCGQCHMGQKEPAGAPRPSGPAKRPAAKRAS